MQQFNSPQPIQPFAPVPPQDPNQQQVLDPRRQLELMALIQQLEAQKAEQEEPPQAVLPDPNTIDGTTALSAGLGAAGNTIESLAGMIAANKKKENQFTKNQALSQALAQQGAF